MRESHTGRLVGRIVELWRYPVKSMAAEPVAEVDVSWHGFAGDRRWAFIRDGVTRSGFPWLTLREREDMSHYRPWLTDPAQPDTSPTLVRTPSGVVFDVTDPALGAELRPQGARVIRQNRGIFDTFPLSLITTQTIVRLGEIVGTPLEVQRFRPNIVVEAAEQAPFCEDSWVGCVLRIGGMRMRVDKRDGRCAVITIDPMTTERNPAILQAVARERQGCLGVYGTTVEPGRMAVNDLVLLAAADQGTRWS
jgi:MOSC domain-containing protein